MAECKCQVCKQPVSPAEATAYHGRHEDCVVTHSSEFRCEGMLTPSKGAASGGGRRKSGGNKVEDFQSH